MASESNLREVVTRLEALMAERDWSDEFGTHRFRDADVRILFTTIKRYGGRRDWSPTEENIASLPGPVRRYILDLRARIQQLEQEAIRALNRR